jgi:hypothetical protein
MHHYSGTFLGFFLKKTDLTTMVCLARELKPNRKLFPDHLSSILHAVLVGANSFTVASLWPLKPALVEVMCHQPTGLDLTLGGTGVWQGRAPVPQYVLFTLSKGPG